MALQKLRSSIQEFIASQYAGGVLLAIATIAALVASNSSVRDVYQALLAMPGEVRVGEWLLLSKPLLNA